MEDFEVHKLTTFDEIRLSRALANEIKASEEQGVRLPVNILEAMANLQALYQRQIEMGIQ